MTTVDMLYAFLDVVKNYPRLARLATSLEINPATAMTLSSSTYIPFHHLASHTLSNVSRLILGDTLRWSDYPLLYQKCAIGFSFHRVVALDICCRLKSAEDCWRIVRSFRNIEEVRLIYPDRVPAWITGLADRRRTEARLKRPLKTLELPVRTLTPLLDVFADSITNLSIVCPSVSECTKIINGQGAFDFCFKALETIVIRVIADINDPDCPRQLSAFLRVLTSLFTKPNVLFSLSISESLTHHEVQYSVEHVSPGDILSAISTWAEGPLSQLHLSQLQLHRHSRLVTPDGVIYMMISNGIWYNLLQDNTFGHPVPHGYKFPDGTQVHFKDEQFPRFVKVGADWLRLRMQTPSSSSPYSTLTNSDGSNGSHGMRRTPHSASPYSTLTSSDGYNGSHGMRRTPHSASPYSTLTSSDGYNGSHGMRRTPHSASPYSTLTSSDGYDANLPGQYPSNYAYAPLPSCHSITSPQPAANGGSRCEWGSPRCYVLLEDATPSGIARHLRQYHDVLVTDNRTRGVCAWGAHCGKNMFPSSFGKHVAEYHLRNMTKQCPYCRADFARADTLSRHIKAFCPHTTGGQATTPSG